MSPVELLQLNSVHMQPFSVGGHRQHHSWEEGSRVVSPEGLSSLIHRGPSHLCLRTGQPWPSAMAKWHGLGVGTPGNWAKVSDMAEYPVLGSRPLLIPKICWKRKEEKEEVRKRR